MNNSNNAPSPSVNPVLFNNDGNFLARFQAMQQQQQQQTKSPQPTESTKSVPSIKGDSKKRKMTVSMKVLKTAKTTNKPKAKLSRFDVFETPEDESGNYSIFDKIFSQLGVHAPIVGVFI